METMKVVRLADLKVDKLESQMAVQMADNWVAWLGVKLVDCLESLWVEMKASVLVVQ
jgi:hypothetical protein